MAAGKSTRTYPLTLTRPKALLRVANKPILAHQLDALLGVVDSVVIIVGYRGDMIREAFGVNYHGLRLEYLEQKEQLGTGHAVLQCETQVGGEPFLAMNGDDLYAPEDLRRLAQSDMAALVKEVPDPRLYGIYEVRDGNRAVRIVEKPTDVFSNLANIGAYKFTTKVFDVLRRTPVSPRGEIEVTSAIQILADEGDFRVVETTGYWLPIGYPWHLLDANAYLLEHCMPPKAEANLHEGVHCEGMVSVGQGTVVMPGVVISGPVMIGRDCIIGPNCWIRSCTTIGNGCRIGQSVEIKNSIFMDGAAASHLSYIGDSVVGERVNLGCGTVTANFRHDGQPHKTIVNGNKIDTGRPKLGAVFGDDVHTGVHTSIYPGRKLWPGTTTLPGQVVDKDIITD